MAFTSWMLFCMIPVLYGLPLQKYEWPTSHQFECAEHLHDKCIPGFERKSVTPSFETCGILELVNCLEKEMNATEHCKKNETLQNKMTGYIKSIKFDFVKSKRCPCAKDIDVIIETLVDPENFEQPEVIAFGMDDDDMTDYEEHPDEDDIESDDALGWTDDGTDPELPHIDYEIDDAKNSSDNSTDDWFYEHDLPFPYTEDEGDSTEAAKEKSATPKIEENDTKSMFGKLGGFAKKVKTMVSGVFGSSKDESDEHHEDDEHDEGPFGHFGDLVEGFEEPMGNNTGNGTQGEEWWFEEDHDDNSTDTTTENVDNESTGFLDTVLNAFGHVKDGWKDWEEDNKDDTSEDSGYEWEEPLDSNSTATVGTDEHGTDEHGTDEHEDGTDHVDDHTDLHDGSWYEEFGTDDQGTNETDSSTGSDTTGWDTAGTNPFDKDSSWVDEFGTDETGATGSDATGADDYGTHPDKTGTDEGTDSHDDSGSLGYLPGLW
eukprot:Seg4239.2 transcript_id=Seg4239.2/GoldUCD/mRNA.D3Y31 product="hypothetical protein" protein_id=Seg4239.2/GoldUCD/D3Y31